MTVDVELVTRVRKAVAEQAIQCGLEPTEKYMFGGLAMMLNGKMVCGIVNDELMVRVGLGAYDEALTHPHVRPMDFTGRPMRGYIFVDADGCSSQISVSKWVGRAIVNIQTLIGS